VTAQAIDRRRYEQAAEWLLKVQADGAPPEAFAEMLAWCDADPANKLAMEKIEEAWAVSADLVAPPWSEAAAGAPSLGRRWLGDLTEWKRDRLGRHVGLFLAVSFVTLAVAIGIATLGRGPGFEDDPPAGERIATARSAHIETNLPDGSTVELGGKSSLSVVYTPQNRIIVAEDGEAFYKVSKHSSRPFVVRAGPVTVTAVGTAFAVRRAGESVSVVVTEGAVEVRVDAQNLAAMRVEAGQRVRFDRGQLSQSVESVAPDVATAWREGRLQFVDEPLRLVIASVNRYDEREILIGDPAVEELRFTGTVFEKGIDTWLQGVAAVFPVRIIEVDKRRVMIAPAKASKG
jgi:transmembrane sensor